MCVSYTIYSFISSFIKFGTCVPQINRKTLSVKIRKTTPAPLFHLLKAELKFCIFDVQNKRKITVREGGENCCLNLILSKKPLTPFNEASSQCVKSG